jgi:tetratricopeptide (TPR) repeat protein
MENHASPEAVRTFMRGKLPGGEARQLVAHLIAGCTVCGRSLHDPYSSRDYDRAFAGVVGADELRHAIALMNLRGNADWTYLQPLPQGQRLLLISNKPRFQHLGLYNRLLELTRQAAWEEPKHGVDLAHLVVAVAHRLPEAEYGATRVADFKAAAHAALGNAHRINAHYAAARKEFEDAWDYLDEGTGDPLEEFELLGQCASLQIHLGNFAEACVLLARAIRKARSVGDPIAEATALIQQGEAIGHVEPSKAIPVLERALSLLGPREDWCRLCARHSLAWFLNEAGRPADAVQVLDATRPLYARFPHALPSLVLHWLEGRIAHKMGDLPTGEQILRTVWSDFREAGFGHHLPLVAVDLAELLLDRGDYAQALQLLTDTYTVMCSWRMELGALSAIVGIRDTVARGAATVVAIADARLTFRRGFAVDQGNPEAG